MRDHNTLPTPEFPTRSTLKVLVSLVILIWIFTYLLENDYKISAMVVEYHSQG
jgi:hypothetical protein